MRDVLDGLIERNLAMIEDEPTLPDDMTAKQALELEMRGRIKLSPSQSRAAKELLPYENPKLTAVMTSQMDQSSFAAALERAILRSKSPPPPPAALPAPQHPASEVRAQFRDRHTVDHKFFLRCCSGYLLRASGSILSLAMATAFAFFSLVVVG